MNRSSPLIGILVLVITVFALAPRPARAQIGACPTEFSTLPLLVGTQSVNDVAINDACTRYYLSVTQSNGVAVGIVAAQCPRETPSSPAVCPSGRRGIVTGPDPFGLDTTPDGNTLYVANSGESSLSVVDLRDESTWDAPPKIFPSPTGAPQYVAVASTGDVLITVNTVASGIRLLQYTPVTGRFRDRTGDLPSPITSAVLKHNGARSEISGILAGGQYYKYLSATDQFTPGSPMLTVGTDGTLTYVDAERRQKFTTTPRADLQTQAVALTNLQTGAAMARFRVGGPTSSRPNAVTLSADGTVAIFLRAQYPYLLSLVPTHQVKFMTLSSDSALFGLGFVRVHNTGVKDAAVTIDVVDSTTGASKGQWTSPVVPSGAEPQFAVSEIEAALGIGQKPARYDMYLSAPSGFFGYVQNVVWMPNPGTITNYSTCYRKTAQDSVATDTRQLGGVHSSVLSAGYPSSVIVTSTDVAGASPQTVALTLYDARNGTRLGQYTTPPIAAGAQLVLSAETLEAALQLAPDPGMIRYVVLAAPFKGLLQHHVNNRGPGVITDMTATCLINSPLQPTDALEASGGPAFDTVALGGVYSSRQTDTQSYLRFINEGTSPLTATVTLKFMDGVTPVTRTWTSPQIPARANVQFYIGTIEDGSGPAFTKPDSYTVSANIPGGLVQHVIWRPVAGTLTDLSTCDANGAEAKSPTSSTWVHGVHSSVIDRYPSHLDIHNNTPFPAQARLIVYDSDSGNNLGTYVTPAITGDIVLPMAQIEAAMSLQPTSIRYDILVRLDAFNPIFATDGPLYVQHFVQNLQTGLLEDLTKVCRPFTRPAQ